MSSGDEQRDAQGNSRDERVRERERVEDEDSARLVARFHAGEREAYGTLYTRYLDRVLSYMRMVLEEREDAEDAAQEVFTKVLVALPDYEQRRQPFRAWLFVVARNYAIECIRKRGRVEPMDPAEIDRRREEVEPPVEMEEPRLGILDWINDTELAMFVERLPIAQRQVLALRFLLGLDTQEIAEALDLTPNHVAALQYRATTFLRDRLTAIGRGPESPDNRQPMRRWTKPAQVLRKRRFSL